MHLLNRNYFLIFKCLQLTFFYIYKSGLLANEFFLLEVYFKSWRGLFTINWNCLFCLFVYLRVYVSSQVYPDYLKTAPLRIRLNSFTVSVWKLFILLLYSCLSIIVEISSTVFFRFFLWWWTLHHIMSVYLKCCSTSISLLLSMNWILL